MQLPQMGSVCDSMRPHAARALGDCAISTCPGLQLSDARVPLLLLSCMGNSQQVNVASS